LCETSSLEATALVLRNSGCLFSLSIILLEGLIVVEELFVVFCVDGVKLARFGYVVSDVNVFHRVLDLGVINALNVLLDLSFHLFALSGVVWS